MASRRLIPDMKQANADLRELIERDSADVAKALDHLIETGTPFFRGKIDHSATCAAGDFVVVYEIADELKACRAAMRARDLEGVSEDCGVVHGANP